MIPAIQTRYAGCHFRSRLEARWAVFFDQTGIEWEYEPQGYLVDGQPYLPDFYLPKLGWWVEVKGTEEDLLANQRRIVGAAYGLGHLLILGQMPDPRDGVPFHVLLEKHEDVGKGHPGVCVHLTSAAMMAVVANHGWSTCTRAAIMAGAAPDWGLPPWRWISDGSQPHSGYTYPNLSWGVRGVAHLVAAYAAARSARFEHGETPR